MYFTVILFHSLIEFTMEETLELIENLITKYRKTQELLYQIKSHSKIYHEALTTYGVPIWFAVSGSEFNLMRQNHLKISIEN